MCGRPPHDESAGRGPSPLGAPTRRHRDDVTGAAGREHPAAGGEPVAQLLDLAAEAVDLVAQPVVLQLQLEDALDPREVDALVLAEPLHLAQQGDVTSRVAPSAPRRPPRRDQPEPVVLPQRLRMHPRQLSGDGDDEHRGGVVDGEADVDPDARGPLLSAHRRLPWRPAAPGRGGPPAGSRPRVWTEMFSDGVLHLDAAGALDADEPRLRDAARRRSTATRDSVGSAESVRTIMA